MLIRIINSIEEAIIAILLASMTLLVFVEVVLRFGFGKGFMWGEEVTLHISAWMVLFGVSYGIKVGSHIGVDALVRIFPETVRRIISGVAVIACLAYTGIFMKGAWVYLSKIQMLGIEMEDLPFPKWIAHSILFIGMVLIAIRLLILLWNIATGKADGFNLTDEAKDSMHLAKEALESSSTEGGKSV